jgi:BTB/POZ domain
MDGLSPKPQPVMAPSNPMASAVTTVRVGPKAKEFYIPKDILTSRSEHFASCLSNRWRRGAENIITIPHWEPETFQALVNWMYSWQLEMDNLDKFMTDTLLDAYVFADEFLITRFKRAAATYSWTATREDIVKISRPLAPLEHVAEAYDRLPRSDAYIERLVRTYVADVRRILGSEPPCQKIVVQILN